MRRLWPWCAVWWACANTQGGGCSEPYEYPRQDPEAAPSRRAVRLRVTQHGLDHISEGFVDVLVQTCAKDDPESLCSVDDRSNPTRLRFFLGASDAPPNGDFALRAGGTAPFNDQYEPDLNWLNNAINDRPYCDDTGGRACRELLRRGAGTSGDGFCRAPSHASCGDPATDYCCGEAALNICRDHYWNGGCELHRSALEIPIADLRGALHISLDEDTSKVTLVVGCDPAAGSCDNHPGIRGYADMVATGELLGSDYACRIQDKPGQSSVVIRSLVATFLPRIVLGDDLVPHMRLADEDIDVRQFDIDLGGIDVDASLSDPACYDEDWTLDGSIHGGDDDCLVCEAAEVGPVLVDWAIRLFETTLGNAVAKALFQAVGDEALEAQGKVSPAAFLPVSGGGALGYLFGAYPQTPEVTDRALARGVNIDFDAGITSTPSPCVREITTPSFAVSTPVDPGSWATTATGEKRLSDLVVMVSDVVFNRGAFEAFRSGALCIDLWPEELAVLSGGVFVPTVGSLALMIPQLSALAPDEAPVRISMRPRFPPTLRFGSGLTSADTGDRDSHLKLEWLEVHAELSPWVDDSYRRAVAFAFDANLDVQFLPQPGGMLQLVIDRVALSNLFETYNEPAESFDADTIAALFEALLPLVLASQTIDVPMTAASLGLGFAPRVTSVQRLGDDGGFLAVYLELCLPADLADPTDEVCYEPPGEPSGEPRAIDLRTVRMPAEAQPGLATAEFHGDWGSEVLYQVDELAPWKRLFLGRGGRTRVSVNDPWLQILGTHVVVFRRPQDPSDQAVSATVIVTMEHQLHRPVAADTPATRLAATPREALSGCGQVFGARWGWLAVSALGLAWTSRRRRKRHSSRSDGL